MIITPFIALVLASTSVFGQAQVPIVYDQYHNATPITGTWSSGSQAVQTGPVCYHFFFSYPPFFPPRTYKIPSPLGFCQSGQRNVYISSNDGYIVFIVGRQRLLITEMSLMLLWNSTPDGYYE